jgi:hypothetical protein
VKSLVLHTLGRMVEELAGRLADKFTLFGRPVCRQPSTRTVMNIYQKQSLPVQFLKFGVDNQGIIVPILRRGKDNFVKLPPPAKPSERRNTDSSKPS